jgi:hypothetical protein
MEVLGTSQSEILLLASIPKPLLDGKSSSTPRHATSTQMRPL